MDGFEYLITVNDRTDSVREVLMDLLTSYSMLAIDHRDLVFGDPNSQLYTLYQVIRILDGTLVQYATDREP